MDLERQLLNIEEQFWQGGADFYRNNLTDDSLMVFPEPVGVLTKDSTVDAIAASPRWAEVRFEGARLVQLADDVALVVYRATAHREGDASSYSALVSSVYVRSDGSWKLAFHQQSPGREP